MVNFLENRLTTKELGKYAELTEPKVFMSKHSAFEDIMSLRAPSFAGNVFVKNITVPAHIENWLCNNFCFVNELLVSQLCHQIDLPCVDYHVFDYNAISSNKYGLFSFNLLQHNEKLVRIEGNSIEEILKNISQEQLDGKIEQADIFEFEKRLFQLAVLDVLTLQSDRHGGNRPYVLNTKEKFLKFGKVFDNERAFALLGFEWSFDFWGETGFGTKNLNMPNILSYYDQEMLSAPNYYITALKQHKTLNYEQRIADLVDYAKKRPCLMPVLAQILQNLNIESAIEELLHLPLRSTKYNEVFENEFVRVEVPDAYKDYCFAIIEHGKNCFTAEIEKQTSSRQKQ